jgi:hypothetical protein
MLKFQESLISAHHNYLVNRMLTPGFLVGDPNSHEDFWFLADVVPPGVSEPRIYARLYDDQELFLVEIRLNKTVQNPSGCVYQAFSGGFRISYPSGDPLLIVHTESFANGFLTRVQGKLYDRQRMLRMEPSDEGVQVYGKAQLALDRPLKSV